MGLRGMFWRFAERRYHGRAVSPNFERWMFAISATFLVVFAIFLLVERERTRQFMALGVVLLVLPLIPALAHMRIRRERAKGRNAIRERRAATDTGYRGRRRREGR